MLWRKLLLGERGEILPHASRSTGEPDLDYGFDATKYPALAEAADA
jgi:hypothetical protein